MKAFRGDCGAFWDTSVNLNHFSMKLRWFEEHFEVMGGFGQGFGVIVGGLGALWAHSVLLESILGWFWGILGWFWGLLG